jgi:hypothetical protein
VVNIATSRAVLPAAAVSSSCPIKAVGDCSLAGIGYCRTKPQFGITAREQLTMCGIQDFYNLNHGDSNGLYQERRNHQKPPTPIASIVWAREMPPSYNFLFPNGMGPSYVRAQTKLFVATLVPHPLSAGSEGPKFDIEYVIQLDIGGKLPSFVTTPVMLDSCRKLFQQVQNFFSGYEDEGSEINQLLLRMKARVLPGGHSAPSTPVYPDNIPTRNQADFELQAPATISLESRLRAIHARKESSISHSVEPWVAELLDDRHNLLMAP